MPNGYEINDLAKEESWRMFRIIGELVQGIDELAGIEPAVTIYGSARLKVVDELYTQTQEIASRLGQMGFTIISGGGSGVMEAANLGALKAGAKSVGLNIKLPQEQECNPYTTKSITFNHFFVRKVMLVKYATTFIIMPGGLGTFDELTEVLTLIQTHKIRPFPVLLFDGQYWKGFLNWLENVVLARGFISENDLNLLRVCDSVDEIIESIHKWSSNQEIVGKKALLM
ncbi:TIGR00730 family Rossman fold protein [Chloroflexota bacterium]